MYLTTTDDPTDGKSAHWSNGKRIEKSEVVCPWCGLSDNLVDDTPEHIKYKKLWICEGCGDWFETEN